MDAIDSFGFEMDIFFLHSEWNWHIPLITFEYEWWKFKEKTQLWAIKLWLYLERRSLPINQIRSIWKLSVKLFLFFYRSFFERSPIFVLKQLESQFLIIQRLFSWNLKFWSIVSVHDKNETVSRKYNYVNPYPQPKKSHFLIFLIYHRLKGTLPKKARKRNHNLFKPFTAVCHSLITIGENVVWFVPV